MTTPTLKTPKLRKALSYLTLDPTPNLRRRMRELPEPETLEQAWQGVGEIMYEEMDRAEQNK